ncbi:hypothetical protein BBJ28_00002243 [Nothophytophthora sp. Chile5]|nr:hypothetical protein BBJ28_00002243 [Nothophytophthora sp. Chile5]
MSGVLRRAVMGGVCRRALAATGVFRAASTRRSLPKGFRSPQAVADAVSASLTAETASETSGAEAANNGTKPVKMERRHLEGDVVATKGVTGHQLLQPRNTPDWQVITAEHFANVPVPKGWTAGLEQLQERLGVQFTDVTLLQSALTHHGILPLNVVEADVPVSRLSNRSLEFLGDSLLGAAAASYLFQMQPQHQEGQLTRAKSALVKNETLAIISEALGITDLLLWPIEFRENKCSMMPTYVKGRVTIAAGALEAVIAAIYLDKVRGIEEEFSIGLIVLTTL